MAIRESPRPVTEDLVDPLARIREADDDRDASAAIVAKLAEIARADREETRSRLAPRLLMRGGVVDSLIAT